MTTQRMAKTLQAAQPSIAVRFAPILLVPFQFSFDWFVIATQSEAKMPTLTSMATAWCFDLEWCYHGRTETLKSRCSFCETVPKNKSNENKRE